MASDALRAIVGSGPADLDASVDAFGLLDTIVNARVGRSLTTVIDTLGLDHPRRLGYLQLARSAGLPAVLVIMNTSPQLCRERNRLRDRPVPAPILAEQLGKIKSMVDAAADEGWDRVLIIEDSVTAATTPRDTRPDRREHGPARRPRDPARVPLSLG